MNPDERAAAELLERFRKTGLRLDRDGKWWHEGEKVEHAGMSRAFNRWLDRLDDGRYILRLDEQRYAYIEVEDTPLIARSARVEGDHVVLRLTDDTEEQLDPSTLRRRGEELRCAVRRGSLLCRLAPQAAYALGDHLREEGDQMVLALGTNRYVIGG